MGTLATTKKSALEAEGYVITWAGPVWIMASELGVQRVQMPDWHGVPPESPATDHGRVVIESPDGAEEALQHLRQACQEVADYFSGSRHTFTVPLDLRGPAFYRRVWAMVGSVPCGETRSYGEIADLLGASQAFRAVGAANGANPVAPFIPCHRIVGSDGALTGYGPGLPLKQQLLMMEGAIPRDEADFPAWVERVGDRLGYPNWILGLRRNHTFCAPLAAPASMRMWPNRLFASVVEAETAGYDRLQGWAGA
jgi:O-6-methylguanine DNA methyltransferase